jgi:hypothetical protein
MQEEPVGKPPTKEADLESLKPFVLSFTVPE